MNPEENAPVQQAPVVESTPNVTEEVNTPVDAQEAPAI